MKANEIKTGRTYTTMIGGYIEAVKIDCRDGAGWLATNLRSHRSIKIKSAQRLLSQVRN